VVLNKQKKKYVYRTLKSKWDNKMIALDYSKNIKRPHDNPSSGWRVINEMA